MSSADQAVDPAALIVYDAAPEVVFDPALHIDNVRLTAAEAPSPFTQHTVGFGSVIARRMLERGAPPTHPWLTVDVAQRELAIGEYERDRVQVALDSVE